jgi:hypothetical protein
MLIAIGLSLSLLSSACIPPTAPPPMSLAKFARDPGGETGGGKIGMATGMLIYGTQDDENPENDEFNSIFFFFPVEGTLTAWLVLASTDQFRLGIIHGIGLGFGGQFSGYDGDWSGSLLADFSGGFFFQVSSGTNGVFFAGAKYTYGLHEPLGGEDDPDYEEPESWTHSMTWSLGYMVVSGGLRITPELIMSYGDWNQKVDYGGGEQETDEDVWIILPSISFAAAY